MRYTIKRSTRARTLRITVYPDGDIIVTAPKKAGDTSISRFVERHEAWVSRALERTRASVIVRLKRGELPELKRRALALAKSRAAHFAQRYGFSHGKISIRAQKSRWGSCSKNGNLSFNYKMAALPSDVLDYIVVHEICHLGAFDHSKKFWQLVEREVPDHKRIRDLLRKTAFIFD